MLEVLYGSGLRVSELCGLRVDDLDLPGQRITVWGKGAKQRAVPLSEPAAVALERWLDGGRAVLQTAESPADAVFVNQRGRRAHAAATSGGCSTGGPRSRPIRTRCATRSPPTCSTAAPTCAPSRSCSVTRTCRPRRSTPTSAASGCAGCSTTPTRAPDPAEVGRRVAPASGVAGVSRRSWRRPWCLVVLCGAGVARRVARLRQRRPRCRTASPGTYHPPVDAPVRDPFRPPAGPYGPGNRGIEYATTPGTRVVAIGPGVVVFAGPVAGERYVTVRHPDGLRSSYSYLATIAVREGDVVSEHTVVGLAGPRLHLGCPPGRRVHRSRRAVGSTVRADASGARPARRWADARRRDRCRPPRRRAARRASRRSRWRRSLDAPSAGSRRPRPGCWAGERRCRPGRSPWGAVRSLATMVDRSTAWWAVSTTFALVHPRSPSPRGHGARTRASINRWERRRRV